ncbi:MAG: hypothetical protein WC159_01025 [Sphaerochaetaceae bacterium]
MKRIGAILLIFLCIASFAFCAKLSLPTSLSATMNGDVTQKDVFIFLYDETGVKQAGESTTIEFAFPDLDEWVVSHTVTFSYSSNLLFSKIGSLSFDVSPLQHDANNVVRTTLSIKTTNPDVKIKNDAFIIDFPKGFSGEIFLGTLTITASKPASQKLAAGEYKGSVAINLTSSY